MELSTELDAINITSDALNRVKRYGRFAEFRLSNGIVLKLKPVPPFLLTAVVNEFKTPPPPKIWMEELGRDEENPNDPKYIAQLEALARTQDLAVTDLVLAVGTEVISVPEGMYSPEDHDWEAQVQFAARITNTELVIEQEDKLKRYLHWLRFYALETGNDVAFASSLPSMLSGVSEQEVDEVMESFRGVQGRGTDTDSPAEPGSQNGHTPNRASRRARPRN